jgi:beta-phosphoglucomutase-like phosphatase (HAD superfamily)
MLVVFDADGVLIDSGPAIRAAYRIAIEAHYVEATGVADRTVIGSITVPDDVLPLEGIDWLGPQTWPKLARGIRELKNREYLSILREGGAPFLPAMETAIELRKNGHECWLTTGAPRGTIDVLRCRNTWWPFTVAVDQIRTPDRMGLLRRAHMPGVYVDDQSRLVDLPLGWHFVCYNGQDADQLFAEITKEEP